MLVDKVKETNLNEESEIDINYDTIQYEKDKELIILNPPLSDNSEITDIDVNQIVINEISVGKKGK